MYSILYKYVNFYEGEVNTTWLGGVEFLRGDYPLMGWVDKPQTPAMLIMPPIEQWKGEIN